jgi:peptidoglycan/LPS O-acetylase OafA/YrhL
VKRIQIIDLVRSASILLVMGRHLFLAKGEPFSRVSFSLEFLSVNFTNGSLGVSLFFVVSGFLITGVITSGRHEGFRINFKSFYARRIARIGPLLLLMVFAGWCIFRFAGPNLPGAGEYFKNPNYPYDSWFWTSIFMFFFNVLLCLRAQSPGLFWGVLWSLSIEEQFYIAYPWILKKMEKLNDILFFLGVVVLAGFACRITLAWNGESWKLAALFNSFGYFDQIAVGAFLFFISEKWKDSFLKRRAESAFICVLGFLIMVYSYVDMSIVFPTPFNYGLVFSPFFISFGCFLFLLGGLHLKFFESKFLRWLAIPGRLSYGCYLFHQAVIFLLLPVFLKISSWFSLVLLVAVTVAFAQVSFVFIERPANHLVRKLFGVR